MLAVGFLPFLIFGALALLPMNESSDGFDAASDPDAEPEVDTPDEETPDGETPEGEVGPTTITFNTGDEDERVVTLDNVDIVSDEPVTVEGSEERDVVEASQTPTLALQLNTLGGDDAVSFGYSTSVDPGEGTDVLELTITQAALDNAQLEFGTITFDDADDALAIDIDEDATGFLHEIRVESSQTVDETTSTSTDTIYYVLSPSETLTVDADASARAGTPVFTEEDTQIIAEIDLGTLTRVIGTDDAGEPTETITGSQNDTAVIALNRDLSSEQTIVLPTTQTPEEEQGEGEEPVEGEGEEQGAPEVTIATNGGEATAVELENDLTARGTGEVDVITANETSPDDLLVIAEGGDDAVSIRFGQDLELRDASFLSDNFDEGTDSATIAVDAASIAAAQATNASAQSFNELADSSAIRIGATDTLTFDLEDEIAGRLVRIDYSLFSLDTEGDSAVDFVGLFIVPDGVDVQAAIDANENGAPDNDLSFLITDFGAVEVADIELGAAFTEFGEGDTPDTTSDTRFDFINLVANRALESFTFDNTAP